MKSLLPVQVGLLVVVAITLGGVLLTTSVYSDVENNIVKVLCLSCIKLEPRTSTAFTFQTANGDPHPAFVRTNLTTGPIVIMYSEDVCDACEQMYPVVKHLLNVSFNKTDMLVKHVTYHDSNVTFLFINIDHTTAVLQQSRATYDKDYVNGVPMFTFITLRYDEGTVRPYYTSVYGTLGLPTPEQREAFLAGILEDSIHLYHENRVGYQP